MKKVILLLFPFIGLSQDCESPILDQILESSQVNQYFQLALSFNINELSYLNDCDSQNYFTIFAPGNTVPTSSAVQLASISGELMDYIPYYIHSESINFLNFVTGEIEMTNGNSAYISVAQSVDNYNVMINQANITIQDICACNGTIHIIDDLIWADNFNLVDSNNKTDRIKVINKIVKVNHLKVNEKLIITDTNGKKVNSVIGKNSIAEINMLKYSNGHYIAIINSEKKSEILKFLLR
tara:strand:- start:547 stop:1263 length:717 start_codon:yes stop_codon:yes gene_type:complete